MTASSLLTFLSGAPANVKETLSNVITEQEVRLPDIKVLMLADCNLDVLAFCTTTLLRDVFMQVLENIEKHKVAGVRQTEVSCKADAEGILITFNNDGTMPRASAQGGGEGIRSLNQRLKPFGGALRPNSRVDNPKWTYSVTLSLLRGEV